MAAIDFPSSPTVGQEYDFGDFTYVWDGVKWTTKVLVGENISDQFVDITGDTMTGQLKISMTNPAVVLDTGDGALTHYISRSGTNTYIAAKDSDSKIFFESTLNPIAKVGGTDYEIYHEGNKPTLDDLGVKDFKTLAISRPANAVAGYWYPVFLNPKATGATVTVQSASRTGDDSMNACTFQGSIRAGGWSDLGDAISGSFNIYSDGTERSIGSVHTGSEQGDAVAFYVHEAAFPVNVKYHQSELATTPKTGLTITHGSSIFVGVANPASIAGSTKTKLSLDFNTGSGSYSNFAGEMYGTRFKPTAADVGALPTTGGTMTGDLTVSGKKVKITGSTANPAQFEAVGTTNSAVMRTSSEVAIFGTQTAGAWAGLLKVGLGTDFTYSTDGSAYYRVYHQGFKPTASDVGAAPTGYGIGVAAIDKIAQEETKGGLWRDINLAMAGLTMPYDGSPSQAYIGVNVANNLLRFGHRNGDTTVPISWFDVYSTNHKPTIEEIGAAAEDHTHTAAEVGALSLTGGTLSGDLIVNSHSIVMKADDPIVQFSNNDGSESFGYIGSPSGEDNSLFFRPGSATEATRHKIYHEGFKPTSTDVGALSLSGGTVTGTISGVTPTADAHLTTKAYVDLAIANIPPSTGEGTPPYDGIRDGVTATAPTENAVFDALAGKAAVVHTHTPSEVGALPITGGTVTGDIISSGNRVTIDSAVDTYAQFEAIADESNKAVFRTSSGVAIIGTQVDDAWTSYIRVGSQPIFANATDEYNIYHEGFKPTASDVGAVPTTGGTIDGGLTINKWGEHIILKDVDNVDESTYRVGVNNSFSIHEDVEGTPTIRFTIAAGSGDVSVSNGYKVYHQGFKPTAADTGALSTAGGTLTGALAMSNSNITGIGGLVFSDAATANSEGIRWPTSDSTPTVYDGIHAGGGYLYFNDTSKIYHQGFKPSASEVGAAPDGYGLGENAVQTSDADALGDQCMFIAGAGDSSVNYFGNYSSGIQSYRSGGGDGTGMITQIMSNGDATNPLLGFRHRINSAWSGWRTLYSDQNKPTASDVGAVSKSGDTMTGQLWVTESVAPEHKLVAGYNRIDMYDGNGALVSRMFRDDTTGSLYVGLEGGGALMGFHFDRAEVAHPVLCHAEMGTNSAQLTRKDYVDGGLNNKLSLSGGTLTGPVSGVAPTADAHLATKAYVDANSSGGGGAYLPLAGGTLTGPLTLGSGSGIHGIYESNLIQDHGNGNVTISAAKKSDGTYGELYLGYSDANSGASSIQTVVNVNSNVVAGGTDNKAGFQGATTGGAFAEMWRRNGVYHSTATHSGSSYAPVLSCYFHDTEGFDGKWSQGVLGATGANPDSWAIGYIQGNSAGGPTTQFSFSSSGHMALPAAPAAADHATRKDYVDTKAWNASAGNYDIVVGGYNQVGTYALLGRNTDGAIGVGGLVAGAELFHTTCEGKANGGAPAGTWKCLGYCQGEGDWASWNATLWIRVA